MLNGTRYTGLYGKRAWGSNGSQMDHHLCPDWVDNVPDELFILFFFPFWSQSLCLCVCVVYTCKCGYKETGHFFCRLETVKKNRGLINPTRYIDIFSAWCVYNILGYKTLDIQIYGRHYKLFALSCDSLNYQLEEERWRRDMTEEQVASYSNDKKKVLYICTNFAGVFFFCLFFTWVSGYIGLTLREWEPIFFWTNKNWRRERITI